MDNNFAVIPEIRRAIDLLLSNTSLSEKARQYGVDPVNGLVQLWISEGLRHWANTYDELPLKTSQQIIDIIDKVYLQGHHDATRRGRA